MAFKVRPDESMRHAVRRMARAQLAGALEVSDGGERPLPERVHEVRTALKKVRALTWLVRPAARRPARRADRRLRDAAHVLADLRDADVLINAFDRLFDTDGAAAPQSPALWRARVRLADRLRRMARPDEAERRFGEVVAALRRARRRVRRWVPRARGWRAVGPGLVAGYRRARRKMARAYEARDEVAFHEWRKAVKAHRHHVYVLEEIWPEEIDVRLHELEHLGELLGEEHDLAMLHETIRAQRDCFAHERDYRRLRLLVDKRRQRLRAEARPLGERLFAERPRDLRRRFRTYFRTSRRRDTDDARAARATREARDATAPAAPDGGHAAATPGPAQGAGGGTATRSSTRTVTTALAGAPPPV